jgi:hypothetical protein
MSFSKKQSDLIEGEMAHVMNSSVCLLTSYTSNYSAFAALTIPHMEEYAERHGYEFRAVQNDDCDRKGGWIKIEPIREALAAGFDFVFWVDIDALVVRKDVDIRIAAKPGADLHMAWHDQGAIRFGDPAHFNSGVMLIRSSDWARDFFMRVWETGQLQHAWADQATILHLSGYDDILRLGAARPEERKHVATLDTAWNSIVGIEVADDPIIHHYAGIPDDEVRLGLMAADAATIDLRLKKTREFRRAFLEQLGHWRLSTKLAVVRNTSGGVTLVGFPSLVTVWLARYWVKGALFTGVALIALVPLLFDAWWPQLLLIYLHSPGYMVHQVEEHTGDRFRTFINQRIFHGVEALTTVDVLWINLPGVWGLNMAALYLANFLSPELGLVAPYLMLVNAIAHLGMAAQTRGYNPGLWTSLAIFFPLGLVTLYVIPASPAHHALGLGAAIAIHLLIAVGIARKAARMIRSLRSPATVK